MAKKSARPKKAAAPRANTTPSLTLRQRAEAKFRAAKVPGQARLSSDDTQRVFHELQVHQIELEMQNEELRRAQVELEASRERYIDLYDLAPVGYVSLSEQGVVLEANLTAAGLLGVERSALVRQPLTRFIIPEDQAIFHHHRKQLFETGAPQVCELRLKKRGAIPFWAQLEVRAAPDAIGTIVGRAVISDISERKEAQAQVARTLAEVQQRAAETEAVLATLNDAVLIYDAGMNVVKANPRFIADCGFDPAGLNVRDIIDRVACRWLDGRPFRLEDQPTPRALQGEKVSGARYRIRPRGALADRMVETASAPLRVGDQLLGTVTVWHDITEREQLLSQAQASAEELRGVNKTLQQQAEELRVSVAEQKRAEAEIEHRASFPHANPNPVLELDRQRAVTYYNPATVAWLERLGRPADVQALVPPDIDALAQKLARGELVEFYREVTVGDAIFSEEICLMPQFDAIRIYAHDITARKEAETRLHQLNTELEVRVRERTAQLEAANRELRASEEKYRTVADFTYAWEYWLGPDGNYLYVSPACERITGYRPEEFQNDPALLEAIAHPADRALLAQHLHQAGANGAPRTLEFRILARNGETRWIGHSCQPVYTSAGKWLGQRGSNRDITERKRAEAQQQQMEVQMQVLHQMDYFRAELIGNISHELRTPLGLILVMATALRKDYILTNLEKRDRILRDIEEEARNLQKIVEQLLDESHLQSGHLVLDRRMVDVRPLIRKIVDLQATQAPQHRLSYQLPEAELLAALDARRIEQVLRNLLDNAVKYSPAGAAIAVRADAEAETLRIAVSDEGPGIPPAERERIFERFYRIVDPPAPPAAGLGLGLSICRGIVEAHGGRLWVEECPGGGSVFVFTLPSGIEATAADYEGREPNVPERDQA